MNKLYDKCQNNLNGLFNLFIGIQSVDFTRKDANYFFILFKTIRSSGALYSPSY